MNEPCTESIPPAPIAVPPPRCHMTEAVQTEGTAQTAVTEDSAAEERIPPSVEAESSKYSHESDYGIVSAEVVPIVSVIVDAPHHEYPNYHDQEQPGFCNQGRSCFNTSESTTAASSDQTPMSLDDSISEGYGHNDGRGGADSILTEDETVKVLKQRNYLLAAITVLLLVSVSIGASILVGKQVGRPINSTSNSDKSVALVGNVNPAPDSEDGSEDEEDFDCEKELFQMKFCLSENDVNNMEACVKCIESSAPGYKQSNYCSGASFNGTGVCEQIQMCSLSDVCAAPCVDYMANYMQCLLSETSDEDSSDSSSSSTSNSLADDGHSARRLRDDDTASRESDDDAAGDDSTDDDGSGSGSADTGESSCLLPCSGFEASLSPSESVFSDSTGSPLPTLSPSPASLNRLRGF